MQNDWLLNIVSSISSAGRDMSHSSLSTSNAQVRTKETHGSTDGTPSSALIG